MFRYRLCNLTQSVLKEIHNKLYFGETNGQSKELYAYKTSDAAIALPRFYPYTTFPELQTHALWRSGSLVGSKEICLPANQFCINSMKNDFQKQMAVTLWNRKLSFPYRAGMIYGYDDDSCWEDILSVGRHLVNDNVLVITHDKKRAEKWARYCVQKNVKLVLQDECPQWTKSDIIMKETDMIIVDNINKFDIRMFPSVLNLWDLPYVIGLYEKQDNILLHPLLKYSLGTEWSFLQQNSLASPQRDEVPLASPQRDEVPLASPQRDEVDDVIMEDQQEEENQVSSNIISNLYKISKASYNFDDNHPELLSIRKDLFMEPKSFAIPGKQNQKENAFPAYQEDDNYLSVPRFYGIEKLKLVEDCCNRVNDGYLMNENVVFEGQLRKNPPQDKAVAAIYDEVIKKESTSGSILNIYCGGGKTATAIYIAIKHGRRTLVLVNNEDLVTQWIDRLKSFAPEAKVGKLQQNECDIEGKDFVIGMLQSVSSRDYSKDLMDTFGLCIVDECHRIACRYFSSAIMKIGAAHILGLSATAYRKDGMDKLMFWTCGPIRYSIDRPKEQVLVKIIRFVPDVKERFLRGPGSKHNRSKMLSDLADLETRNQMILQSMLQLYHDEKRTILLLCDRLSMVDWFRKKLSAHPDDLSFGEMTGGAKRDEREAALAKRIILATYMKAKEGLDVPQLDTLILGTPVSDVVQSIGRILRKSPDKNVPLVIDVWDQQEPFTASGYARQKYYKKQSYTIEYEKENN